MSSITDILAANPILLLFTVIGLGYLIGNIKVFGFKLGVAAVLFVGIAFGAIDNRLSLPDYFYILGLVLFVYALGLQAGPGFFASFHKRGIRYSAVAVVILAGGAIVAIAIGKIMGMNAPSIAGLYCGALTNTPALAAAVETIKNMSSLIPADQVSLYVNSPVVTYGLAYPFGVFGVIFWFFIFTKIYKIDFAKEATERATESTAEAIVSRTYRITNPAVIGKTVEQALAPLGHPGFTLSRIKRRTDVVEIVSQTTTLESGNLIIAVGPADALEMARILFGEESPEHVAEKRDDTSYRLIFVSNRSVAGKSVRELQASRKFVGSITRLRRGEVEFVPSLDTILELGDRIMVVTPREQVEQASKFFGDSVRALSETDFLSLSLGIVLGVFLGMIPFPLLGGMNFRLGFAGGPLIVGIILGRLERTGPIQWGLPYNANLVLRQTGLVFFLAAIGTKAGPGFGATFQTGAWGLFAAGALVTSFVSVSTIIYAYKRLKLPMSGVMGMMSGLQTQPACLAYANQQSDSDLPNLWYATVQPASMIAKIALAQIIVSSLLVQ
jgi:putative transport protein